MNIDRIAREMVDVEPSTDLEARIRARVRATEPERGSSWWLWRVAMPVAAAAAVTIAIALRGPASQVERPAITSVPVQTAQVSAPALPPRAGAEAGAETSVAPHREPSVVRVINQSRVAKNSAHQLSAEELAWMERRMPALDPVTALEMDHLRVDSIQPEPLAITPLIMPPVTTEGSGIERRNDR